MHLKIYMFKIFFYNIYLGDVLTNEVLKFHRPNARLMFVAFTDLTLDVTNKNLLKEISSFFKKIDFVTLKPSILAISVRNDIFGFINGKDNEYRLIKEHRKGSEYQVTLYFFK